MRWNGKFPILIEPAPRMPVNRADRAVVAERNIEPIADRRQVRARQQPVEKYKLGQYERAGKRSAPTLSSRCRRRIFLLASNFRRLAEI
jgi:hypothetical protein